MLTGTELLDKVKEVGDVSKTELAKACGYVINKKDGSEQVKFTQFYEALLEAKGISFNGTSRMGKRKEVDLQGQGAGHGESSDWHGIHRHARLEARG